MTLVFARTVGFALVLLAAAVLLTLPAAATPTQITFFLNGTHPVDKDAHQGTFTAPAPLCPSGTWLGNAGGARTFTCGDGSGTFRASFDGNLEHVAGSTGDWAILSGTGKYATLRGGGTAHVDASTGESVSPVVFKDTWTGTIDFDATAPSGSITKVHIVRPHSPKGRWQATVSFAAHDDVPANPVAYKASASAGSFSTQTSGTVTSGAGSFSFSFRKAKRTHLLQIEIELTDPIGNQARIARNVRLR